MKPVVDQSLSRQAGRDRNRAGSKDGEKQQVRRAVQRTGEGSGAEDGARRRAAAKSNINTQQSASAISSPLSSCSSCSISLYQKARAFEVVRAGPAPSTPRLAAPRAARAPQGGPTHMTITEKSCSRTFRGGTTAHTAHVCTVEGVCYASMLPRCFSLFSFSAVRVRSLASQRERSALP